MKAALAMSVVIAFLVAPSAHSQRITLEPQFKSLPATPVQMALQTASIHDFPKALSTSSKRRGDEVIMLLRAQRFDEADLLWATLVRGMRAEKMDSDAIYDVMLLLLQKGILESNAETRAHLEKLAHQNRMASAISDYMASLADAAAKLKGRVARLALADPKMRLVDGKLARLPVRDVTLAELREDLKRMQQRRDTLSGLSDELSLKLQEVFEKQQQAVQALSKIMKKMQETAQAITSNIKS